MRTSDSVIITTCSATLMLLQYVTSATVTPCAMAASRSTWSEPIPAVTASFRFLAAAMRSGVRYAGQNGCEMTTSASGSSRSKTDPAPSLASLSEVTTSVCPRSSRKRRRPSSPVTLPSRWPGVKSVAFGVGAVWPPG